MPTASPNTPIQVTTDAPITVCRLILFLLTISPGVVGGKTLFTLLSGCNRVTGPFQGHFRVRKERNKHCDRDFEYPSLLSGNSGFIQPVLASEFLCQLSD
ncbi:hypothetical protein NPIL_702311 [Nephila pilipes]|uniref:Uncharacterized protein n=1 Tax=Nephila pilipes TaxID=299642 RepID=A0A8X6N4E5_NEPPI|nr:hypothetical protein NPIL_702311 [Nephila pilipes]